MNNFQALIGLLNKAKGKRTYTLVVILIGYVVLCDFTNKPLNDRVVGVLIALAAGTIRAAIPEQSK